jgi:uncharacterized Zn finger protein (UPF0148 family)
MAKLSIEEFKHNAKVYDKQCPECKTKFYTNRPEAIYCSPLCRQRAYLERKELKKRVTSKSSKVYVKKTTLSKWQLRKLDWIEVFKGTKAEAKEFCVHTLGRSAMVTSRYLSIYGDERISSDGAAKVIYESWGNYVVYVRDGEN